MSQATLECIYKETGKNPLATVIWLHGLGADGYDFEPIVEELNLPASKPFRFVFPHAPVRPVTINQHMEMRAWYDIKENNLARREDEQGVLESSRLLELLIRDEKNKGYRADQIFIAGFSQGGAIALYTALMHKERLAGALILSAYLPLLDKKPETAALKHSQMPVMMMHGTQDPVVPPAMGKQSYQWLKAEGCNIEWKEYAMPHSVCHQEVSDIAAWFLRCLN